MIEQSFSLTPFPAPILPALSPTGKLSLQNNILTLHYALGGNVEEVLFPSACPSPSRKDELWKATCFRLLGIPHVANRRLERI
jgi:hypothetical protein